MLPLATSLTANEDHGSVADNIVGYRLVEDASPSFRHRGSHLFEASNTRNCTLRTMKARWILSSSLRIQGTVAATPMKDDSGFRSVPIPSALQKLEYRSTR